MQPNIAEILVKVDWRALRITLEVARTHSIKRAAESTNLTESTVSRYVGALEEQLGFFLFERSSAGMSLTGPGERLVERLFLAETEIEVGLEAAIDLQHAPVGRVRLTTVPSIANRVLTPKVAAFLEQYPDLELELIGIPTDLSMFRREADIAIRLSRPARDLDALTRKLGTLEYAVYASKDACCDVNDGSGLAWITYDRDMDELPHAKWIENFARTSGEKISTLKYNDAEGLICAALSGAGKILLPRLVAKEVPGLAEVKGYGSLPSREIWLLVHPNIASTERIRTVVAWLERLFA